MDAPLTEELQDVLASIRVVDAAQYLDRVSGFPELCD